MTAATVPESPERVVRAIRMYRSLLVAYPRDFRDEYHDDLVQAFSDLMVFSSDTRGVWWRTARDLISSAGRERLSSFKRKPRESLHIVLAVIAGIVALILAGPGATGSLVLPLLAIPVITLIGLPVYGASRLREAWVVRRTTGAPVRRHVWIGLASFVPGPALLIGLTLAGEDAGYLIFVAVSLALISGSVVGIVWAAITLARSRRTDGRANWRRPAMALIPAVAILTFIIGASYNSYRQSLGPPGDHSVANASADTRALWEAADAGDVDAVIRLTTNTCADPWVKFPVGDGRHNAKGQAEELAIGRDAVVREPLDRIADLLGDYMDIWHDTCGKASD